MESVEEEATGISETGKQKGLTGERRERRQERKEMGGGGGGRKTSQSIYEKA